MIFVNWKQDGRRLPNKVAATELNFNSRIKNLLNYKISILTECFHIILATDKIGMVITIMKSLSADFTNDMLTRLPTQWVCTFNSLEYSGHPFRKLCVLENKSNVQGTRVADKCSVSWSTQ